MQECAFGKEEIWLDLEAWAERNVASGSFEPSWPQMMFFGKGWINAVRSCFLPPSTKARCPDGLKLQAAGFGRGMTSAVSGSAKV
jgi:hypothetical protein